MTFWRKKISINPAQIGYLYRRNRLAQKLEPGIYRFFDFNAELEVIRLPTIARILTVTNQEVLTKDNIALRFSYFIEYKISDGDRFLSRFDVFGNKTSVLVEAEQAIHSFSQGCLREVIVGLESETLNEKRSELLLSVPGELQSQLKEYGLEIIRLTLRDLTFPKNIQDLFAKQLEAKVRARADLENARTVVATARALKNASELMKGDDNIRFMQFLETMTKIAEKGKHTFIIGDVSQPRIAVRPESQ